MTFTSLITAVVIDASAAVPFLAGETLWTDRWAEWARSATLRLAPAHFRVEVANALLRGSDLDAGQVPLRLLRLGQSGVDLVDRGWHGLVEAVEIAARHRLTVYDALYLQLALDIEAPLATLDRALATAARAEGLEVIGATA